MQVMVFAAQKGGSGKTTLAANIAVQAERKGDGPVAEVFIPPADLANPFVQGNTDGWFYGTIRNGVRLMPRYGAELTSDQVWQIVTYLRTLEQSSP